MTAVPRVARLRLPTAALCVALGPACVARGADGADPRTADQTVASFVLPEGFKATVFAAEPDVMQPIGFCFDDRGRVWVAECFSYPNWKPEGNDRILVLEDTDGDGKHDRRTVFFDKLNYVTGIEVGFGGVWVASAPNLLFIPDRNSDDQPDGPPQILLDGFGHQGVHNLVNGFTWGPDGWALRRTRGLLHGRHRTPRFTQRTAHLFRRRSLPLSPCQETV
jgi:putative membrane-bound dehydrogenase-like protein